MRHQFVFPIRAGLVVPRREITALEPEALEPLLDIFEEPLDVVLFPGFVIHRGIAQEEVASHGLAIRQIL